MTWNEIISQTIELKKKRLIWKIEVLWYFNLSATIQDRAKLTYLQYGELLLTWLIVHIFVTLRNISPVLQYGRGRDYTPDRDDDSDPGYEDSYQPRQERPRTAINFVSAKQRALSKKAAGKTMQRWNDLLKMIELDKTSFDILDLPPVNEYDLYIRAFGGSNTRQVTILMTYCGFNSLEQQCKIGLPDTGQSSIIGFLGHFGFYLITSCLC